MRCINQLAASIKHYKIDKRRYFSTTPPAARRKLRNNLVASLLSFNLCWLKQSKYKRILDKRRVTICLFNTVAVAIEADITSAENQFGYNMAYSMACLGSSTSILWLAYLRSASYQPAWRMVMSDDSASLA